MKKGDQIVCIDEYVSKGDQLTYGKVYKIEAVKDGAVLVLNERGIRAYYRSDLFVQLKKVVDGYCNFLSIKYFMEQFGEKPPAEISLF